ncbi:MAG: MFS transporter [Armatimonadetes bacterium]|nr:MFS transporter [Armatimonadota bacterium]
MKILKALNPYAGLSGLPALLWWLALATLINRAGSMVLPFLVLYLTRNEGLTPARAGSILMLYGFVALFASTVSGRLCDRWGPQTVMVWSLLLSGATMLVYPLADGVLAIALATSVLSLFSEAFRPASMAVIPRLAPAPQRRKAFALNRLAVNLGMSIGPVTGGILAGWWFPSLFLVDGTTAIAAAGLLAFLFLRRQSGGPGSSLDPLTQAQGSGQPAHRNGRFLLFLLSTFLIGLVFFQLDAAMPLYLVGELGLTERDFGMVFTINTVLILLFEVPLNARTASWSHRAVLSLGAVLIGLGFGALALVGDFAGVAATVVIWTLGEMILFPTQAAYVADLSPPGGEGQYMGLFTTSFGLAFTLGPALGAWLLERFGPAVVWSGALGCGLMAAVVVLLVVDEGDAVPASPAQAPAVEPAPSS